MNERIPLTPPEIKPISDAEIRPLFSVMIPSFNCIKYLSNAINSVLAQDLGPDIMQIEVLDDYSTDGDVAGLVEKLGNGRIQFYQQNKNVGSLRNFETCLNRARGYYIHILHGDDYVKEGFYNEIDFLFKQYPEAGAAFSSYFYLFKGENEIGIAEPLSSKPIVFENFLEQIAQKNLLQPPCIVVKREIYEHLGGFFAVHFGEDWEMWNRISAHYKMAYSPKRLAVYRSHDTNITTRSHVSLQSIDDISKVIDIIQNYLPPDKKSKLNRIARKNFSVYFSHVARQMYFLHSNSTVALKLSKKAIRMQPSFNGIVSYIKIKLLVLGNWKFFKKRFGLTLLGKSYRE